MPALYAEGDDRPRTILAPRHSETPLGSRGPRGAAGRSDGSYFEATLESDANQTPISVSSAKVLESDSIGQGWLECEAAVSLAPHYLKQV